MGFSYEPIEETRAKLIEAIESYLDDYYPSIDKESSGYE
jgi:hypothetical protein